MALTVNEVLNRTRVLINDTGSTRFTNASMFLWLSDAVREVRRLRPSTTLDTDGNLTTFTEITGTGDTIPLDDDWRNTITNYMCYRGFSEDAVDQATKNKATHYYNLFNEMLKIS